MKRDRIGKTIDIQGDKPLLISDPTKAWLITAGELNIFTVPINGKDWGERDYVFTAPQGTLLLGMLQISSQSAGPHDQATEEYAFLASASPGVQLKELEIVDVLQGMQQSTAPILEGARQWFLLADKYLQSGMATQYESLLQSGMLPQESQNGLTELNREMLAEAVKLRLYRKAAFQERILKRNQNREHLMRFSLQAMASSVDPGNKQDIYEAYDCPLFEACLLVAKSKKIDLKPPSELMLKKSATITLDEIIKVSNVNSREVLLEDRWWENDVGSLLGYMKQDGRPVAIIAVNSHTYIVDDVTNGSRFKVTAKNATLLKSQAIMFYRPLPYKKLTLKDIAIFGYENVWKLDMGIFIGIGLLGTVFGMITPKITEILFNQIIPDGSTNLLAQLALVYFVVLISQVLLDVSRSFASLRMEGHVESSLEAAVMDRVTKLPVAFFKDFTTGDLTSRVNSISTIRSIISGSVMNAVISGVFGLTYLVMLFTYSMQLTLIALLMVAITLGINIWAGLFSLKYTKLEQISDNKIYGQVFEYISGIPKFRSAGAEERAFHRWGLAFSKNMELKVRNGGFQTMVDVLNTVMTTVFSMVFFFMIIHQKMDIPLGKFTAFQSAFAIFSSSILGLMKTCIDANRVVPLYELAKPILETLPECDSEKQHPGVLKGAIEVKHVNFRYQANDPLVLKDVSLMIHEGEYVGIVGQSGSGKSTLFRILLGFEKPEAGQVYFDGKDLSTVDVKAVRRQFVVVLQNAHVMTGSIFSNIVGSNYQLSLKDAEEAVKMAGLEEDVKQMPMGMQTIVPDGGGTLSGGQRQRMVIARALVNKPKILFFDEATSALDNRTQEIVSESLRGLKATRVVIAHRLSTIINCDRIIVMKDGRIIEEGTYQELMTKTGLFAELAQRQLA
jgi:NHLM bacteriocin system ABC transporter ATP-binding protein